MAIWQLLTIQRLFPTTRCLMQLGNDFHYQVAQLSLIIGDKASVYYLIVLYLIYQYHLYSCQYHGTTANRPSRALPNNYANTAEWSWSLVPAGLPRAPVSKPSSAAKKRQSFNSATPKSALLSMRLGLQSRQIEKRKKLQLQRKVPPNQILMG